MQRWHIRDIILVTIIAIFMGVIFWVTGPAYSVLSGVLAPFGLQPFANDLLLGIWVMAGPLAGFVIRIPGSATLGEFLGAAVEMFLGGAWGAATLISGAVQGIGSELGFAIMRYKHYNWVTLTLSAITTTLVTFSWDYFRSGYNAYHFGLLMALLVTRFVSIFVFGGVLTRLITNLLARAHVLPQLSKN